MTPLGRRLVQRIARHGPITLADYMAEALTHPEHGYYTTGDPFGAAGDFTTAPEISQMFGELLGLWCVDCWQRLGAPDPVLLVELGPGRGTLLADALRAAKLAGGFLEAVQIHLVEASPRLRQQQRQALGDRRADWHDNLGDVPEGPLLVLANEFFDALPVRQFERDAQGWCERLVVLGPDGKSLAFGLAPPSPIAARLVPTALAEAPAGSLVEVSPASLSLAAELGRRASHHGGAALVVDYGRTRHEAGATLQAVRKHAPHGVLESPGAADLTAHVDFAALAGAAREAGAAVHGPVTQGRFLEALGIEARAQTLIAGASQKQAQDIRSAQMRLTDPNEMGELFKAMAIASPALGVPAGFP
jgi:NADH dehydrogenase [ubiquinone] 1 alpha subcomplex assembly factor 7